MSPTSYQLLHPATFIELIGTGDRGRTGTGITTHGILSPGRLPVPPRRRRYKEGPTERSEVGGSLISERSEDSARDFSNSLCEFEPVKSAVAVTEGDGER